MLSTTLSSFSTKLSATRTRITALSRISGSRQGLTQRPVRKATAPTTARPAPPTAGHFPEDEWWLCGPDGVQSSQWQGKKKGWVQTPLESPSLGVAVRINETGRGAERVVYELHHTVKDAVSGRLMLSGRALVAKESPYIEDDDLKRDYHYCFCKTQQQAGRFARKFNERVAKMCAQQKVPVPAVITFLAPTIYTCSFFNSPSNMVFLVEKMLDRSGWTKWNSNDGYVDGQSGPRVIQIPGAGPAKPAAGDDEEDDDDRECEHDDVGELQDSKPEQQSLVNQGSGSKRKLLDNTIMAADVPQEVFFVSQIVQNFAPQDANIKAFSHYTYHYSQRKSLVCNLQGTLDTSVSPALFELTDPVIHHVSNHKRQRVYGRTDRGRKGMDAFFRSHKCNALCRLLWLPDSSRRLTSENIPSGKPASLSLDDAWCQFPPQPKADPPTSENTPSGKPASLSLDDAWCQFSPPP
eukprot:gene6782-3823_t